MNNVILFALAALIDAQLEQRSFLSVNTIKNLEFARRKIVEEFGGEYRLLLREMREGT